MHPNLWQSVALVHITLSFALLTTGALHEQGGIAPAAAAPHLPSPHLVAVMSRMPGLAAERLLSPVTV